MIPAAVAVLPFNYGIERKGFQIGDQVQWRSGFDINRGTGVGLVDATYCVVQKYESDPSTKLRYDDLLPIR